MDGSSDLETKYNKIAAEYAKLRAQASVLKKAVIEEQSRNSTLQDVLREREQNFRKSSQEIDSLTFRNQQLTKRVTVLQNELDASENRLRKGKSKIPDNHSCVDCKTTMHVLDEELQKKILENAELVSRMQDEDSAHRQELAALQSQIEQLRHELKECAKVNNKVEVKSKVVDKLELNILPNTDVDLKQKSVQDQEQLSSQKAFESHTQSDANLVVNSLPFGNNFEISSKSESCDKPQLPWMISKMSSHVPVIITALMDYHTLMEQRLNHLFSNISPTNQKLSSFLKESSTYLQSIQLGFNQLQRAALECEDGLLQPELQHLSGKLSSYSSFLMKILPYHLLSIEEENATLQNEEHLVSSNILVAFQINCVINSFIKLSECIKVFCSESVVQKKHSNTSPWKTFPLLGDTFTILAKSFKDLASAYAVKCHKEQKILTFSEEVKKSNESIVNALSSMVDAAEKISNSVSFDQMRSWKLSRVESTAGMQDYQNGECTHILDQDEVSEQIAINQKKMVLLEQEKEHWHLEYQLLQLKHSKRTQELEEQLKLYKSAGVSQNALGSQLQEQNRQEPCTVTNLLGRLEMPLVVSAEVEAREREVKNYLTNRIDHLVAACQEAETKAVAFRAECAVLRKRLDHCISSKMQCECRLNDSMKQIMKLQEELQTTTHNYEAQLSIMSEHLANMNEKLTLQTDEIDQLKYQLNNKTSHKRKQK